MTAQFPNKTEVSTLEHGHQKASTPLQLIRLGEKEGGARGALVQNEKVREEMQKEQPMVVKGVVSGWVPIPAQVRAV